MRTKIAAVSLGLVVFLLGFVGLTRVQAQDTGTLPTTLTGIIMGTDGPVSGAVVQVQGTPNKTTTANDGSFTLRNISWEKPVVLTAWYEGYYVGWVKFDPTAQDWKGVDSLKDITIKMKPLFMTDNVSYPWFSFEGVTGSESCGLCHREYKEWKADAHSQSAQNPRFLSVYQGTNLKGDKGQLTVYSNDGTVKAPDPAKPYYGVGYKLDNPSRTGNCATCHTPVAGKIPTTQNCAWSGCHTDLTVENSKGIIDTNVSPLSLKGDAAEGITCDFCHKVVSVDMDPKTNLPYPDMPGILSMNLTRPVDGEQIFYGTLVDINRRVSYSELESKSEFCSSCHYGVFGGVVGNGTVSGGTVIYNSYGEWLESSYSDPKTGKTCQDCHMKVLDTEISVFPEKGGIPRDYAKFHEHYMPGASDEEFLKNAVSVKSNAQHVGDQLQVSVSITNDNTGHDIPTDAPTREMILVVEALDANGKTLDLVNGPVLPTWSGNYANQPGKSFAKVLKDELSGEMPTVAYWRPVTIVEDTRLAANATDSSQYSFTLPSGEAAQVKVKLLFRRTFQAIAEQKGWNDPDILMAESTLQVEK
jgi:hypothetical protein